MVQPELNHPYGAHTACQLGNAVMELGNEASVCSSEEPTVMELGYEGDAIAYTQKSTPMVCHGIPSTVVG